MCSGNDGCVAGMDVLLRGGMDVVLARGSGGSGEQGIFAVCGGQPAAINQSGPFGRVIDATPLAASDGANPLAFLRCGLGAGYSYRRASAGYILDACRAGMKVVRIEKA